MDHEIATYRESVHQDSLVRNKLLPKGLRMAIEEGDMEHWEILLEPTFVP